ncbi:RNA-directed DNA polymerase, eukaryota, Reverse transcriptase zinc-binding domain protein [Artemisia annua]|uniref:RNA-directed DNA polymerase, eukaryota, Reverse transcriptase zinc-binding domain protein n=1 Tax=Artemisia annua TaxID=35608 RepID=A0A2U1L3E1_ARTAN|nr:RNA-directed DNA polymerase, eukaryota, Reverse transcriptase zinc-binding domain protein [Artemisia annua]
MAFYIVLQIVEDCPELATNGNVLGILARMPNISGREHYTTMWGVTKQTNEVSALARKLVCEPSSFPFTYLGLPVGASMSRSIHWQPIIDRFRDKLSSWKAKNVSYEGHLTLVKSVLGSGGDSRKISWIAWDKVLSSSEFGIDGKLGVVSDGGSRGAWERLFEYLGFDSKMVRVDVIPLDGALNVLDMADDGDLNLEERTSSFFDVVVLCAIGWI